MKYPFMINSIPHYGAGMSLGEKAVRLANRLYGFFFCPVGEDMDHVILAWGGFSSVFSYLIVDCKPFLRQRCG